MLNGKKPKRLTEAQNLQEATLIVKGRNGHPSTKSLVDVAFKVKDESARKNLLQEAEEHLQADEKKKLEDEKKPEGMKEYYEPAAGSGAGKSGKSYQSSGATLPSLSVEKSSPAGADSQPGKSQLQEAADEMASQVADMGSVDPMNTCVISKMGEGMSELEAQNACAREQGYAEAMVLNVMKKMRIPEILHSMAYHETNLSEAMKLVKTDVDSVKKPGTIMMKPQGAGTPGGNLQETSGETPGAGKVIDLTNIADQERFKQDLMAEYAQ